MAAHHPVNFSQIREGMSVMDREGNKVGIVEHVQFSDENPSSGTAETITTSANPTVYESNDVVTDVARALFSDDRMPEAIRNRLMHAGYIKIERGLLQSDCFATLDQIASVEDDEVYLLVDSKELIHDDMR